MRRDMRSYIVKYVAFNQKTNESEEWSVCFDVEYSTFESMTKQIMSIFIDYCEENELKDIIIEDVEETEFQGEYI